jgi:RimJ/RimL family protein N-acetyltransferase
LRAVEREDLPMVATWFNDPETRRTIASHKPMSLTDEVRWLEAMQQSSTDYVLIIDVNESEAGPGPAGLARPIGVCGIHRIDWKNRACMVGITIGRVAERGKGYGTDAMHTLVRYAHHELGLVRVELEVFPHNTAGVRSYQKLGFVTEGARRSAFFRDGMFHDLLLMSCLPGELKDPA